MKYIALLTNNATDVAYGYTQTKNNPKKHDNNRAFFTFTPCVYNNNQLLQMSYTAQI
jgi:hypothetical protein